MIRWATESLGDQHECGVALPYRVPTEYFARCSEDWLPFGLGFSQPRSELLFPAASSACRGWLRPERRLQPEPHRSAVQWGALAMARVLAQVSAAAVAPAAAAGSVLVAPCPADR